MKIIFVVYNVRRHGDKTYLQNALRDHGCKVQEVNVGPEGGHKLRGSQLPKADVTIVHGYMSARVLARRGIKAYGLRVFYAFNDPPALRSNLRVWRGLRRKLGFTLVIASQRDGLNAYRKIAKQAYYVPYGCAPGIFKPHPEIETTHDIAFVGDLRKGRYDQRRKFLERLRQDGFEVFSTTGPSGEEFAKCLWRGKIGWNQTISWAKYGKARDGINFRCWEVLASGRMLLTNYSHDLERLGFKPGKHLVFYESYSDCLKKLRRYLRDDAAREKIAAAGRKKAIEEHTCFIRAWRMLEIFKNWL